MSAGPAAEAYWNPRRLALFRRFFLLALVVTLPAMSCGLSRYRGRSGIFSFRFLWRYIP